MMCSVGGCKNGIERDRTQITLTLFPTEPGNYNRWVEAINNTQFAQKFHTTLMTRTSPLSLSI